MAGWHHQCNGYELGQTLGDGEGQGRLACRSPCSCKESDMTGQLNNCLIHSPYSSSINYSNTVFYNFFFPNPGLNPGLHIAFRSHVALVPFNLEPLLSLFFFFCLSLP